MMQNAFSGDSSILQLKAAVGLFFVEFSAFESLSVGTALRSLAKDSVFVEHAERLLDFEARLKLLERMASARGIPSNLWVQLQLTLSRARKLADQRDEVARNLAAIDSGDARPYFGPARRLAIAEQLAHRSQTWMPAIARIQDYAKQATDLQDQLRLLTEKFDRHLECMQSGNE